MKKREQEERIQQLDDQIRESKKVYREDSPQHFRGIGDDTDLILRNQIAIMESLVDISNNQIDI